MFWRENKFWRQKYFGGKINFGLSLSLEIAYHRMTSHRIAPNRGQCEFTLMKNLDHKFHSNNLKNEKVTHKHAATLFHPLKG